MLKRCKEACASRKIGGWYEIIVIKNERKGVQDGGETSGAVCFVSGPEAKTGGGAGSWQDEDVEFVLWRDSECNRLKKKNV